MAIPTHTKAPVPLKKCHQGLTPEQCRSLKEHLDLDCATCNLPGLFTLVSQIDPDTSRSLLPVIQEISPSSPARAAVTGFHCPEMDIVLKKECQCQSCAMWIDYKASDNCLLAYAIKAGKVTFSKTEIAYLLGYHPNSVDKALKRSLDKLRSYLASDNSLTPDFILVPNDKVCVVCESIIEGAPALASGRFVWCCDECLREKDVSEVAIESQFGVTANTAISWLINKFRDLAAVSKITGVSTIMLQRIIDKNKRSTELIRVAVPHELQDRLASLTSDHANLQQHLLVNEPSKLQTAHGALDRLENML